MEIINLLINENKNLLLSLNSKIEIYMTQKKRKKLKDVIIIYKEENKEDYLS